MFTLSRFTLLFFALYLPYEEFILSSLGFMGIAAYIAKQLPDGIILVLGSLAIMKIYIGHCDEWSRQRRARAFSANPLLALIVLVVLAYFYQVTLTGSPLIGALQTKALIRYVFAGLLACYCFNFRFEERFRKCVLLGVGLQVVIVALQRYSPEVFGQIFLPTATGNEMILGMEDKSTGYYEYLQSDHVSGTFRHNINLAFYLLVGFVLALFGGGGNVRIRRKIPKLIMLAAILFGIYASGSRIAFIVALAMLLYRFFGLWQGRLLGAKANFLILLMALVLIFIYSFQAEVGLSADRDSFLFIFSERYLDRAEQQRLGLVYMLIDSIRVKPTLLFYGLGFNHDDIHSFIWSYDVFRPALLYWDSNAIEDVYWIALTFYFGLIPAVSFLTVFVYIFIRASHGNLRDSVSIGSTLLIAACILAGFNQSFEVRSFSYYLWVFVAFDLVKSAGFLRAG